MQSIRPPDLRYLWDVILVLVNKELKLRYRGTTLGILWSLGNPIAFAVVLYVAFKRVFQVQIDNYPLFILSALFAWQWLSNSVNAASLLFFQNAPLIKKLSFPRPALCLAVVLSDMIHFLVTIPVVAVLAFAMGGAGPGLLWLVGVPVLVVVQASLTFALVVIVATANAFLRDLDQLVRICLLLLFYVTPILFSVGMVPDSLKWVLFVNPVAPPIIAWRALLAGNDLSPYIAVAALHATVLLVLALRVYRGIGWRLAEVV